jgi:hypothetical protein
MAMIGVFWVYQHRVFGKRAPIEAGEEAVKGMVDSPYDHVDVWETDTDYRRNFPELVQAEYQQIPRGRVLYQTGKGVPVVYLDSTLNTPPVRELIARFFEFPVEQASWQKDAHYTTRQNDLDALFDEE